MKELFLSAAAAFLGCLLAGCGGAANSAPVSHPVTEAALQITSSSLPSGAVQTAYGGSSGFALTASGGIGPYSWSWAPAQSSTLPAGLSLSVAGLISGTPTASGMYNIAVTVADSESPAARASANYSITIAGGGPLTITSAPPPNGTVGQLYGGIIIMTEDHCLARFHGWLPAATGGIGDHYWNWSAAPGSSLPPGLTVGRETYTCGGSTRCCVTVSSPNLVQGVPTEAGMFHVILTITDSETPPMQVSANYTITITASTNGAEATKEVSTSQQHTHYKLVDLGTFGGPQSYVNEPNSLPPVLNDQGTVAGWADTSTPDPYPAFCFNEEQPCYVSHAFQWKNGEITDLNALPGGGSSTASWISPNGLIAGYSENGETDPSVPGLPEIRAVLWKNAEIQDLGTLPRGGYESQANAVNSRGQVVGGATNTTPDIYSLLGGTETRAFLWQNGVMEDLGTLGGADSVALLVNESGQVVGQSFLNDTPSAYCAGLDLPVSSGAFLWEHGKMTNLGSFGGTCTFATDLNDLGQVVGLSTLEGDEYQHAFLWQHGLFSELHNTLGGNNAAGLAVNNSGTVVGWASLPGNQEDHASLWEGNTMTDLGTLDGDPCSFGFSVNATGQVVGISGFQRDVPGCDSGQTIRAFLWERGSMVDLNALIPYDSGLYLTSPETINDQGEIAGVGFDLSGNQHAFLLVPCDQKHLDVEGCDYSPADSSASVQVRAATGGIAPLGAGAGRVSSEQSVSAPFLRKRNLRQHFGLMPPQ
jgi:probable HAF family extracellular repeat protein